MLKADVLSAPSLGRRQQEASRMPHSTLEESWTAQSPPAPGAPSLGKGSGDPFWDRGLVPSPALRGFPRPGLQGLLHVTRVAGVLLGPLTPRSPQRRPLSEVARGQADRRRAETASSVPVTRVGAASSLSGRSPGGQSWTPGIRSHSPSGPNPRSERCSYHKG